jgi:hypothetical protein
MKTSSSTHLPVSEEWCQKTTENRLLCDYQRAFPGTLWIEVGIIRNGSPHRWPDGSTMRRLDGVLILGEEPNRICWRPSLAGQLLDVIEDREVHLLEAKRRLTRGAIGQARIGRLAFALDYPGHGDLKAVAVVGQADPALQWIASQDGVDVWESPSVRPAEGTQRTGP